MKVWGKQVRALSLALVCAFCLNLIPARAFSAAEEAGQEPEPGGLCEHHPFHTEECGYTEEAPGLPCNFVCPVCSQTETPPEDQTETPPEDQMETPPEDQMETPPEDQMETPPEDQMETPPEDQPETPCYLLLIHSLAYDEAQYGFSEVIRLTAEDLLDGCDLRGHLLEKEGMEAASAACLNLETGDMDEGWILSPDSFFEGGDPEEGEAYLAAQAVIEYRVLEGYRPELRGDSPQSEDPYGVMPLTSFEGGNIKDITFVPADVLTVRLQYKYSPTGGLAGMDAAESQVFQMKVDGVTRDPDDGQVTGAPSFTMTWPLPHYDSADPPLNPTLEGFRIVLDAEPLNKFVNRPDLAEKAMNGKLTPEEIREALENDSFSVKTDNPEMPVYQWQQDNQAPPASYDQYPQNVTYQNRYSDKYNLAWEAARTLRTPEYTAYAVQKVPKAHQGANQLADPELTLELTADQCMEALENGGELTVTVYYRRNAGFYHVGHWVPQNSLSSAERDDYTQNKYPEYNQPGVDSYDAGYIMVYLERKQGRVGALTNARPNPPDAEGILKAFNPRAVSQKTIEANTRVDILYDTADRYGLIFQTDGSYIPRQYVNKGDQVIFKAGDGVNSGMSVTDSGGAPVSGYVDYKNPTRQGYSFAGWKYEVRSDAAGSSFENGKYYKTIKVDDRWDLSGGTLDEAVVTQDSDSRDAKMIYLYPVWSPDEANVRVVFWIEDLGGGNKDVQVTVDDTPGGENYRQRVNDYMTGTPLATGDSFSNVGSFTFKAPTNSGLALSLSGGAFASAAGPFTTTGESLGSTGTENKTGTLKYLIDQMFPVRMLNVSAATGPINTSRFYSPYGVGTPKGSTNSYTVAADGSTVINVYYARKVYTLDFTYYGNITYGSGTKYDGGGGMAVATNTTGYSAGDAGEPFNFDYHPSEKPKYPPNRWQLVANDPNWTVPRTLSISAKYDADLREVWPLAQGEEIALTLPQYDKDNHLKDVAVFMSWGTTAGPFNQHYRDVVDQESTIIGSYRSMSADIIADPEKTAKAHHLVAYWWNQNQSYYRRNACYEVPGLTAQALCDAVGTGEKDVKKLDLTSRTLVYQNHLVPDSGFGNFDVVPMAVPSDEKERRDSVYLVPVEGSSLDSYFADYHSNFIEVDDKGEPKENGGYYAVRWIEAADNDPQVYALGRQAISVSTNYITAQTPSSIPSMTSVSLKYDLIHTWESNKVVEYTVSVDHDTQAWDDWGRTANGTNNIKFIALGTAEHPYDIWFYYKRARFTIYYMVASRNSSSGEYEIGRHETIYGQSLKNFNRVLPPDAARKYSDAPSFQNYWTPKDNTGLPLQGTTSPANGLNAQGYTRLCPDSAENGLGEWTCAYWSLDRSGSGEMQKEDWDRMVTGNLRVFAQWTPPNYRVKFDFDGGSYNGSETFKIQTVKANVGYTSSGNTIPSPTKDGFEFGGWTWYEGNPAGADDLTAGNELRTFTFETPITRDLVLKAKWTPSAKKRYDYKVWYLTESGSGGPVTLPANVEGRWLDEKDGRGTPQPDLQHQNYTDVLGCQYVQDKAYPENTVLSLAAVAIPGYAPVKLGATLALVSENNTGAADTQNVAYFYYRKSRVKSYTIRFQLWDRTGEEGILPSRFNIHRDIADSAYFTPLDETWRKLKDGGYYLVQMDANGTVQLNDGEPIAAGSYTELDEFIEEENRKFDAQGKGTNLVVTFKVAPYFYTIQYNVGTVRQGSAAVTPSDRLKAALQAALDRLRGEAVQAAAAAGKNPTQYVVADFDDGHGFTLKNPPVVRDPDDPSKRWRFTGWTPAPGTVAVSRASAEEYPTLLLERSEGDLAFLANWELVVDDDDDDDDPDDPPDSPKPPVDLKRPLNPSTGLPDPNLPDAPESITVLADGVLTTYWKVWDPEAGAWIYAPEEAAPPVYPIHVDAAVPKAEEDSGAFPWGPFGILSFAGLAALCCPRPFRNRGKKKG